MEDSMGEDNLTSAGMSMTEEQQSMPLRDAVFMSLRKAILTGKLKPGDRLTEVKLGKILGTSRTPIREAIRLLEADGLVTIVAGSGARVSRMTVEDLQEVMEIRSALEQLSAGLASERITEEEKEQLREACASFNRAPARAGSRKRHWRVIWRTSVPVRTRKKPRRCWLNLLHLIRLSFSRLPEGWRWRNCVRL